MPKSQNTQPRRKLLNDPSRGQTSVPFADHTGRQAISAYYGRRPIPSVDSPILPPQWCFQSYVTYDSGTEIPAELAEQLLKATRDSVLWSYPIRLDVHFLPGASLEDCVAHYRTEKLSRSDSGPALHMLDPYSGPYSNFSLLVVVPDPEWKTNGATIVSFDFSSDLLYDEDEWEMKEAHCKQVNVRHGVAWQRLTWDSQEGQLVGKSLHDLRAGTGADDLQDIYEARVEQGHSDWN